MKLHETHWVQSGLTRLRRGEIAQLTFGEVVKEGIPAARFHWNLIGNNIMYLNIIDKLGGTPAAPPHAVGLRQQYRLGRREGVGGAVAYSPSSQMRLYIRSETTTSCDLLA